MQSSNGNLSNHIANHTLFLVIPHFNQYQVSIQFNEFGIVNSILLIKTILSKFAEVLPSSQKWQIRLM